MQTTAIGTVANSLPENEVILLTILISDGYIPYTELRNNHNSNPHNTIGSSISRNIIILFLEE